MRKKGERSPLGGDSAESSENAAKKRCVMKKKPVHVSHGGAAEICRQGGKQQQQNAFASGGHADNGIRLIGGNVVAAKETVSHVELDSSSASMFRSIPLQQLRALARAAEVGGSTVVSRADPHLRNQVLSPSSGGGASSSAAGREERRTQLFGRSVGHQEREKPKTKPTGQRLDLTSKAAKKSYNKRLPAEVSCRRPHYATGQPLACTSVLPACRIDEFSPSACRMRHTSHKADGVCPSVTGSSAGGSSSSSLNTPAKNSQGEGESYVRNGESGGRTGISGSILSCLGNEDAKAQPNAASHNGPAKRVVSPKATAVSEREVLPGCAQRQLATEELLQAHGMASLMERTRGRTFNRLQQEREAALQRHLKCLRSLRMRVGAEAKGAARANSLRVGREVRDPRFSEACGPLDLRMVGRAYAFLDNMRKQEAEELQRLVKKSGRAVQIAVGAAAGTTGEGRGRSKEKLRLAVAENEAAQKALQRLRSQEEARKRKGVELAVKGQLAREEKARIAQTGKKPFFVSRRALNRLVQAEWQKTRHGGNACGQRRAAKQEERKARNKLAKERRQSLLPVRRYVEKAGV